MKFRFSFGFDEGLTGVTRRDVDKQAIKLGFSNFYHHRTLYGSLSPPRPRPFCRSLAGIGKLLWGGLLRCISLRRAFFGRKHVFRRPQLPNASKIWPGDLVGTVCATAVLWRWHQYIYSTPPGPSQNGSERSIIPRGRSQRNCSVDALEVRNLGLLRSASKSEH